MIDALILTSMALELLLLLGLFLNSRAFVRRSFPGRPGSAPPPETGPRGAAPRAALIVALTGASPEMRLCLESLLHQDYPNYDTVLVTRDPEDPATSLALEVLAGARRARHVLSGPAAGCSQKNYNLRAGLAVLDPAVDLLVFCDSTHRAPPDFLRHLLSPLIRGEAVLATGYHRVVAEDHRLGTLGRLQVVLILHLLMGISRVAQPWGGATAVRRSIFEKYRIARVWSENVIDDLSLWVRLRRAGIRVQPVAAAVLATHLAGQTVTDWVAWLTRQLFYLKYCLPGTWLASALIACLLPGPVLLAALACLGGILGLASTQEALVGLGFLLAFSAAGACYRSLVPQKIPLGRWLLAIYAAPAVTFWSYLQTWLTHTISWRGISYRVTWGGKVRGIIRKS
jgi:ceramide glucosyltransferase